MVATRRYGGNRRIVGDEALAEPAGDVTGALGLIDQEVDDLAPLFGTARSDAFAQYGLGARVVVLCPELPSPIAAPDVPAGETARDRLDIPFGIAFIHSEDVQFHQLAREVLVGALLAVRDGVEIAHHRGTGRTALRQVAEGAQRVLAEDLAVIDRLDPRDQLFLVVDVEVVRPEVDHHLVELAAAGDGAIERGRHQFVGHRFAVLKTVGLDLVGAPVEGDERVEGAINGGVVDRFGIELGFQPCLDTLRPELGQGSSALAEGDPVEQVGLGRRRRHGRVAVGGPGQVGTGKRRGPAS